MTRQEMIDALIEHNLEWARTQRITESQLRKNFGSYSLAELRQACKVAKIQQEETVYRPSSPTHLQEKPRIPDEVTRAAKAAVVNSPEYQENIRLKKQIELDRALLVCLQTPIDGKYVEDNIPNRGTLTDWLEAETNPISDVKKWFINIVAENPKLGPGEKYGPLVWFTPVSRQEKQRQGQEQFKNDVERFYAWARKSELVAISEANFNLVYNELGPGLHGVEMISEMPNGYGGTHPVLITANGDEIVLTPPDKAEVERFRQERFEIDQDHIREMARTGDIAGLRQRAQRDRTQNFEEQAQLRFEYSLLKSYGERMEYRLPPLPETWHGQPLDASFLHKATPAVLKEIMGKHGSVAMNVRLHSDRLPKDFLNHWQSKLVELEEQLGMRRANFTRLEELQQALADSHRQ